MLYRFLIKLSSRVLLL